MATSGTYSFNPAASDIALEAFARLQLRGTAITQQHMYDCRLSCNFMNSAWQNKGLNLWTVDLQTIALVQGTATYSLATGTTMLLDGYIETTPSGGEVTDRYLYPISRTEFASIADKTTQAPPTSYWFDRLPAPTVTFWPIPDGNGPYTFKYYRQRQIQDTELTMGLTADLPYRFLDAYAAELAQRLCVKYPVKDSPNLYQILRSEAKMAWDEAAATDREPVAMFVTPGLSRYYRP